MGVNDEINNRIFNPFLFYTCSKVLYLKFSKDDGNHITDATTSQFEILIFPMIYGIQGVEWMLVKLFRLT